MIDNSDFCSGCNRLSCKCPPPWLEDARYEDAYVRGYDRGQAEGAENRPDPAWLSYPYNPNHEVEAEAYLAGFDDGAAERPCRYRDSRLTEHDEEPEALGFQHVTIEDIYPLPVR